MAHQISLPFGNSWGGARKGAGRKAKHWRSGVPHVRRPVHKHSWPLHVTVRVREGLPSLRSEAMFRCVLGQIRAAKRRFLRIVHFSVQSNHLHLLIEAGDRAMLSRGMKGFGVRTARRLNRLLRSRGSVWGDRYHARALNTPREVRNALVYVLFNHKKHGRESIIDSRSSAVFVDGWRAAPFAPARGSPDDWPVACSGTWLMGKGWKRLGLLDLHEAPAKSLGDR